MEEIVSLPPREKMLNSTIKKQSIPSKKSRSIKKQSIKKITTNIKKIFAQPLLVRGIMQKKHMFQYNCPRCQKGFNMEFHAQQHSQTQCDRQFAFAERQRSFKKADYS